MLPHAHQPAPPQRHLYTKPPPPPHGQNFQHYGPQQGGPWGRGYGPPHRQQNPGFQQYFHPNAQNPNARRPRHVRGRGRGRGVNYITGHRPPAAQPTTPMYDPFSDSKATAPQARRTVDARGPQRVVQRAPPQRPPQLQRPPGVAPQHPQRPAPVAPRPAQRAPPQQPQRPQPKRFVEPYRTPARRELQLQASPRPQSEPQEIHTKPITVPVALLTNRAPPAAPEKKKKINIDLNTGNAVTGITKFALSGPRLKHKQNKNIFTQFKREKRRVQMEKEAKEKEEANAASQEQEVEVEREERVNDVFEEKQKVKQQQEGGAGKAADSRVEEAPEKKAAEKEGQEPAVKLQKIQESSENLDEDKKEMKFKLRRKTIKHARKKSVSSSAERKTRKRKDRDRSRKRKDKDDASGGREPPEKRRRVERHRKEPKDPSMWPVPKDMPVKKTRPVPKEPPVKKSIAKKEVKEKVKEKEKAREVKAEKKEEKEEEKEAPVASKASPGSHSIKAEVVKPKERRKEDSSEKKVEEKKERPGKNIKLQRTARGKDIRTIRARKLARGNRRERKRSTSRGRWLERRDRSRDRRSRSDTRSRERKQSLSGRRFSNSGERQSPSRSRSRDRRKSRSRDRWGRSDRGRRDRDRHRSVSPRGRRDKRRRSRDRYSRERRRSRGRGRGIRHRERSRFQTNHRSDRRKSRQSYSKHSIPARKARRDTNRRSRSKSPEARQARERREKRAEEKRREKEEKNPAKALVTVARKMRSGSPTSSSSSSSRSSSPKSKGEWKIVEQERVFPKTRRKVVVEGWEPVKAVRSPPKSPPPEVASPKQKHSQEGVPAEIIKPVKKAEPVKAEEPAPVSMDLDEPAPPKAETKEPAPPEKVAAVEAPEEKASAQAPAPEPLEESLSSPEELPPAKSSAESESVSAVAGDDEVQVVLSPTSGSSKKKKRKRKTHKLKWGFILEKLGVDPASVYVSQASDLHCACFFHAVHGKEIQYSQVREYVETFKGLIEQDRDKYEESDVLLKKMVRWLKKGDKQLPTELWSPKPFKQCMCKVLDKVLVIVTMWQKASLAPPRKLRKQQPAIPGEKLNSYTGGAAGEGKNKAKSTSRKHLTREEQLNRRMPIYLSEHDVVICERYDQNGNVTLVNSENVSILREDLEKERLRWLIWPKAKAMHWGWIHMVQNEKGTSNAVEKESSESK